MDVERTKGNHHGETTIKSPEKKTKIRKIIEEEFRMMSELKKGAKAEIKTLTLKTAS